MYHEFISENQNVKDDRESKVRDVEKKRWDKLHKK